MDPVPLAVASVPLALYLVSLGAINLRRRPFVATGALDIAALAAGLCGLVIVGPMNLFLPEAAAMRFGPLAWLLLLGFYGLCVLLYVLLRGRGWWFLMSRRNNYGRCWRLSPES